MTVNFDALLAASVTDADCRYDETDAILYALGAGFGQDGADPRERNYVYEGRALRTVPSMACNLLTADFLSDIGWDSSRARVLDQKLELYRPLPASAEMKADRRVVAALDQQSEHGERVVIESEVRMSKDGTVLFTVSSTLAARGAGGTRQPANDSPWPHSLPERDADLSCELHCHSNQPLIFRLCGDRNPLHADDAVARSLGFRTTPVQEQCVAGIACRAILKTICEYDFTLISGFDLRYAAPVYPGDVVTTEMWQERNIVSFRCVVRERDAVVIDNGQCTLVI